MALTEHRKKYLREWYRKNLKAQRKRTARNKQNQRLADIELAREKDRIKSIKYKKRRLTYGRVKWAVESGKMIKPKKCNDCLKRKRLFGHHPDYNKPLEVIWVCMDCHMKRHPKSSDIQSLLKK